MKKILLSVFSLLSLISLEAQTYNSCTDTDAGTAIVADVVYTVGTIDGDMPPIFCKGTADGVDGGEWVKYVPDDDYEVTVSSDLTQNGDKDTRVQIFTGNCVAATYTCVGGDDDSGEYSGTNGNSYLSVAVFEAVAGETYYIVWDDKWTNSSDFDFILTEGDPAPPPPPTPVTFTQQSINATGSYDQAIVDMNGDFLDDVVSVNHIDVSYPDGVRTETPNPYVNIHYQLPGGGFNDVTIPTTLPSYAPFWSIAAGDINADGYNDLLYGDGNGVSFMIANSNGTAYNEFSINEYVFSQRSNFVDINNDGFLDAFVCHDVDESLTYLNQGPSNNYALVSSNTNGLGGFPNGGNYASIWVDYDNDRDIDMFMAKCGGSIARRTNELYQNNGDGTYTEVGVAANMADPIQTWSAAWGDFDNDGDMDAYVGSSDFDDPNTMMENNGDGTFTNVTIGAGVDTAAKGYENIAADFDNDGNLDIFTNGNMLFGNGDLTFSYNPNLSLPNSAYGGSIGDLNNDGFLDMFGSNNLYLNNGNTNNWIKIVTEGMAHSASNRSNRNGIGARVEISTPSGVQIRDVRSGEGFRYMHTMNTHFGIGTDTSINYIRIYWPSGVVDNINNPTINSTVIVQEGQSLNLNDTLVDDLIAYPNPTTGIININTTYGFESAIYTVFDIAGRRVLNGKFTDNTIDVTNITAGNYILRIMNDGLIKTQKFIKK